MRAKDHTTDSRRATAHCRAVGAVAVLMCVAALACNFPVIQAPTHTPPPSVTPTAVRDLSDVTIIPPTPVTPATFVVTATTGPSETAAPTLTPTQTETPRPTETLVPTLNAPYPSAGNLLRGVCFAYLRTLENQQLVFTSAGSLNDFYNKVNESKKCADPVSRASFDFNGKQAVGTVIAGQGCSFLLSYDRTDRDTNVKTQTIVIRAEKVGDCPYVLVQAILFAVDTGGQNSGYKTQVRVER